MTVISDSVLHRSNIIQETRHKIFNTLRHIRPFMQRYPARFM